MSAVKLADTKLQDERAKEEAQIRKAIRLVVETSGSHEAILKYLEARGIR